MQKKESGHNCKLAIIGLFTLHYRITAFSTYLMQEDEVHNVQMLQPCIWARGGIKATIVEVKLVVEKRVITSVPARKALLLLLSTFYTFNMEYTEGCSNFYKALEIIFLKAKRDTSRLKVNRLLGALDI